MITRHIFSHKTTRKTKGKVLERLPFASSYKSKVEKLQKNTKIDKKKVFFAYLEIVTVSKFLFVNFSYFSGFSWFLYVCKIVGAVAIAQAFTLKHTFANLEFTVIRVNSEIFRTVCFVRGTWCVSLSISIYIWVTLKGSYCGSTHYWTHVILTGINLVVF